MNIAQVTDRAIKLIAQYSNGGEVVIASENTDYLNRANDFIDQAQKQVATKSKIHAVVSYSQYPIEPINGKYYGFEMKQFLPTIDDLTDIQGIGARSFYFEANWNCECYIEESTDEINWTTVPVSYISGSTPDTANPIVVNSDLVYVAYKGLISPTLTTNYVRLRFTSLYPFVVRNRALWDVPFVDYTYVPVYAPKLEVEVNNDKWMEFDRVVHKTDSRIYEQMLDFSSIGRKTFIMDYFYTGSFDLHFYKVPEDITSASPSTTELEVYQGMAQEAIPYYVGGHMIIDEYPKFAMLLLNEYQAIYENLKTHEINGSQYVSNTTGW